MKRVILFFGLCCLFSWPFAGLMAAKVTVLPMAVTAFAFMCGPGLAGIVMALAFHKGERADVLGLKLKGTGQEWAWLGLTYAFGMIIIIGSLFLSLLGNGVNLQSPAVGAAAMMTEAGQDPALLEALPVPNLLLAAQWALLAPLLNIPLMLSEELGWRGWLWSELRPRGFWITTLITGVFWGVWHVPIIALGHNYPGMPLWGPIIFTVFCVLYAPLFSLVREKTHSVWGACVLHATTNGAAALSIVMLTDPPVIWKGLLGIGGFVMIGLFAVLVWRFYTPNTAHDNKWVTPAA